MTTANRADTRMPDAHTDLTLHLAHITAERDDLTARLAAAERQLVELRAGYQHKLDEERGKQRGAFDTLARWLQTAIVAVRADPPRLPVVEERLEEALILVRDAGLPHPFVRIQHAVDALAPEVAVAIFAALQAERPNDFRDGSQA